MRKDPREYVSKKVGIPVSELEVVYEHTTTKWDCDGPSWSHYSWEETDSAVVVHRASKRAWHVYDDYIDQARNIYHVEVDELTKIDVEAILRGEIPWWLK